MRMSAPVLVVGVLAVAASIGGYLLLAAGPDRDGTISGGWTAILAEVPLETFERVESGPREFPRDHGAHPAAPMETWNVAAHLRSESGEDLGFQLHLARLALVAPDAEPAPSDWDMGEFYRGHTILVAGGGAASAEERLRRGFAGIAGYDAPSREWRLDNWVMRIEAGSTGPVLTIAATVGEAAALELRLVPEKTATSPGADGVAAPFRGYSMTRLSATGALVTAEGRETVAGLAWLDHLWGDLPFPTGPTAWDRLLLQADDGTDISLTRTRRREAGGTSTVEGFIVGPDGGVSRIESATAKMEPVGTWSPGGSAPDYPVAWHLSLGGDREMAVSALVDDQLHDFVLPVWSGAVTAHGSLGSGPVEAVGTLQLNGYAAP